MRFITLSLLLLSAALPVNAALSVLACEPEWAALTTELGQEYVKVHSATHGKQDPHYIQARPSLIAKARRADLLVCTGAQLEEGWLPLLLRKSANAAIQPNAMGHFMATDYVALKGIPNASLDRSAGHIHLAGNPHIQLDPYLILTVAKQLSQRLQQLDPENQSHYQAYLDSFTQQWQRAISRWEVMAKPLVNMPILVQHDNWHYLVDWLKLKQVSTLEKKPGVEPSVKDLDAVLQIVQRQPVQAVVRAAYQPPQAANWLAQHSQLPIVVLPFTVGGETAVDSLYHLYDVTIERLLIVTQ